MICELYKAMTSKIKGRTSNGKFMSKDQAEKEKTTTNSLDKIWFKVEQLREEIYSGYFDQQKIEELYNQLNAPADNNIRRMKVYILSLDKEELRNNLKGKEVKE